MKRGTIARSILGGFLLFIFSPINLYASNVGSFGLTPSIANGFIKSLIIYIFALLLGLSILIYNLKKENLVKNKTFINYTIPLLFVIGFLTRVFTSVIFEGHPIDIACFKGWASSAASNLATFYTNGGFVDYPPLYIYVLSFIEKVRILLFANSPEWVHTLIIKFPAILADVVGSYLLYVYGKRYLNEKKALLVSFIYLFNPVTILDSSLWGQVDSIFVLLLIIGIIKLIDKNYIDSTIWFALALLFKPQGLIFLPVLFFVIVKEKNLKLIGKCFLTGLITFILPVLPFSVNQRIDWIVKLYFNTTSSYKYASVNAYNFFSFIGANWKENTEKLLFFSYGTWGTIFLILTTLIVIWYILTSKNQAIPTLASAMLIIGVYVLSSKMHERYIFPVLLLLLVSYILVNKKELLILYSAFTFTSFLSILQVFSLSLSKIYWVPANDIILKTISFINILLFIAAFIFIISLRFYITKEEPFKRIKVESKYKYNRSKKGRKK